ncbi:MAG: toll/interleukin-1 receptor domain-containing protein [Deltaproteobacteria bacterium]|nr:toll/interleukin-1 receptor domain-containing protein [Deltaproteobacteria bacterium]
MEEQDILSYDWREYLDRHWSKRFPEWALGADEWRSQSDNLGVLLQKLCALRGSVRPMVTPRVFVSHRQVDEDYARRVAWLADQAGFDFWLDVLDPNLQMLNQMFAGAAVGPVQRALAIANVVEMALLNSSHVLAVMTPNTQGSQWVPYEYGRAKDQTVVSVQAACWVGAGLSPVALPEYLHLGIETGTELGITAWFDSELQRHRWTKRPVRWRWPVPAPLPL